jgi:hypothetical protein
MNVSVLVFQAIAEILPPEILDRAVEWMNFHFTYKHRKCSLVFEVTEHNSNNPCASPLERLLNFYSLATIAKLDGANASDIVTIPNDVFGQICSVLMDHMKNHTNPPDKAIMEFVTVGGDLYMNPMGVVVELRTSPV